MSAPRYWQEFMKRPSTPVERRAVSPTSDIKNPAEFLLAMLSGGSPTVAGITVTPLKALGVATVFACVRVLSETLASLPFEIHQRQDKTRRKATDHRLFNVLSLRPHEELSSVDLRYAMMANLCLRSNAYAEILRDSDNDAIGLYPIESNRVDVTVDTSRRRAVRYRLDNGVVLDARDVIHLRRNTLNGLTGLNLTSTTRDCIGLALALQDNAIKFFANGSRPSGVLEHPAQLSGEAQDRLRSQFEKMSSGENLYKMLVLEEGLKFAKERSENRDSQFIEAKDAQNLEICRVFGVPPHKVGILNNAPRANVEEENIGFVVDVIRPECVRWEQEFDYKLLSEEERDQGYCCRFDLDELTRGNMKARYDSMAIGRQWGFLSQNDCRQRENLPPIDGGDTYLQPLNMVPHDKAMDVLLKNGNSTENTGFGSQKQA